MFIVSDNVTVVKFYIYGQYCPVPYFPIGAFMPTESLLLTKNISLFRLPPTCLPVQSRSYCKVLAHRPTLRPQHEEQRRSNPTRFDHGR